MSLADSVLKAYVVLRSRGQPPKEALERLRPQIEALDDAQKRRVVAGVRYYETRRKQDRVKTKTMTQQDQPPVLCEQCDTLNWNAGPQCRKCGASLGTPPLMTRKLGRKPAQRDDLFYPTTTLILRLPQHKHIMELCPQDYDRSLIFGRIDHSGGVIPDADFTDLQGMALGVSRLHMALTYDERHNQLIIKDMGSANGVFVNGQRLSPYETRVLRNGDRLELGQLVIQVVYAHDHRTDKR